MPPARRLPFYLVMLFCLCLCSLALREVAPTERNCLATSDTQDMAQHGAVPDDTHAHDHDHPVLQVAPAAPQARSAILRAAGSESLPARSRAISPLLPPPKTVTF